MLKISNYLDIMGFDSMNHFSLLSVAALVRVSADFLNKLSTTSSVTSIILLEINTIGLSVYLFQMRNNMILWRIIIGLEKILHNKETHYRYLF